MSTTTSGSPSSSVLVATSDSAARDLLGRAATLSRVEVMYAADGVEALALARRMSPDLVLLDNFLAVLDGSATCARIRNLNIDRQPMILLAGVTSERMADQAFEVGADDVLRKPLHVAEIRQRVVSLLERRRSEDRLRLLERSMEHAMSGITILDGRSADYPVRYVNATFAEMTGYAKDELLDHNLRMLAGPETDVVALGEMREAMSHGRPCRAVIKNYKKDGTTFWNELSLAPVRDEAGLLAYWVGIQTDASVRVRVGELALAQQELEDQVEQHSQDLREALARLEKRRRFTETLLDALESGVITTDAEGHVSFANRRALDLLQISLPDCLERPIDDILGADEDLQEALEGGAEKEDRLRTGLITSPAGAQHAVELSVVGAPEELKEELGRVISFRVIQGPDAVSDAGPEAAGDGEASEPASPDEPSVVPLTSLLRQATALLRPRHGGARRPLVENPLQELPPVLVREGAVVEALLGALEAGLGLVGDAGRIRVHLCPAPSDDDDPSRGHAGMELKPDAADADREISDDDWQRAQDELAIVRQLLDASQGQVEAARDEDGSWRLTIRLPVASDPDC